MQSRSTVSNPSGPDRHREDVLRLIMESATRAAMLIEAQEPDRRAAIEEAIMAGARDKSAGDRIAIRRPSVLAQGTKPA